jgi:hypothetical protein
MKFRTRRPAELANAMEAEPIDFVGILDLARSPRH